MKYNKKAAVLLALLGIQSNAIQIDGQLRKRHSSPFDGVGQLQMVQLHGIVESSGEKEFGHLSLCEAEKPFTNCSNASEVSWQNYEREQALLLTSKNSMDNYQHDFDLVLKARSMLESNCKKLFDNENLPEQFPRGNQSQKALWKSNDPNDTTEDPLNGKCKVYVYQHTCLYRFLEKVKTKMDEALQGEDLCRHMLKKVDDLYAQIDWLKNRKEEEIKTYHAKIKQQLDTLCCDKTCKTCQDPLNSEACITCETTQNRGPQITVVLDQDNTPIKQTCDCMPGFRESVTGDVNCVKCLVGCLNCKLNNGREVCLQCDTDNGFILNQTTKQCGCPSKQYINREQDVAKCSDCNFSCQECESKDKCTKCDTSKHRKPTPNSQGKCECESKHYEIEGVEYCPSCHYSCETCVRAYDSSASLGETPAINLTNEDQNGEDRCIRCVDPRIHEYNGTKPGKCLCPTCTWENYSKICQPMNTGNKICLNAVGIYDYKCIKCRDNAELENGKCVGKVGYFVDIKQIDSLNTCGLVSECSKQCKTCVDASDHCTSCKDALAKVDQGKCVCQVGYILNSNGQCDKCDITCKTCQGPAANECTSCQDKRIQVNSNDVRGTTQFECKPQPGTFDKQPKESVPTDCNPTCAECLNSAAANNCTKCKENQQREPSAETTTFSCVCKQEDSLYEKQGELVCQSCKETQKTCQNENIALSCYTEQHRVLINHECICADGFFELNGNKICNPCSERCLTCKDAEHNCTSCQPNQLNEVRNGSCACGKHQFWASESCLQCDPSCESCTDSNSTHCLTTDQPKAFIEGENQVVNHIFIIPNNQYVNSLNDKFLIGYPDANILTVRQYCDKKVKETIENIIKRENVEFGNLFQKNKSSENLPENRIDITSVFYYTPQEVNPQQQLFFKGKGETPYNGQTPVADNTTEAPCNLDVAVSNVVSQAESQPEKFILYVIVHHTDKVLTTDEKTQQTEEINKFTEIVSELFKEENPNIVSVNVIEIGEPIVTPIVKQELQPETLPGVKESCTQLEQCIDIVDKLTDQKVNPTHPTDLIHNIFVVPNSKSSQEQKDLPEVKQQDNSYLPVDIQKYINNGKISVQEIAQFAIEEVLEQIIKIEKDITEDSKKQTNSVIDYNPTLSPTTRTEREVATEELVDNKLPLTKVDPQNPTDGISNLLAGLQKVQDIIDAHPTDKYVVTIFIDGSEDRLPKDEQNILAEIKKLGEEKPVVTINVIEILAEKNVPVLEEIHVATPKNEDIIKSAPTVEVLDQITEEIISQPNPFVEQNGNIHNVFVLPNDKNSNTVKDIASVTTTGTNLLPATVTTYFFNNQGKQQTTVTALSNESAKQITLEGVLNEVKTSSIPQSLTILDYNNETVSPTNGQRTLYTPVTEQNKPTLEALFKLDKILPKPTTDSVADLIKSLQYLVQTIQDKVNAAPKDKFVVTIYIDESNPANKITPEQVKQITALIEKIDQYGIVNVVTVLTPSTEPQVVDMIRDVVVPAEEGIRESINELGNVPSVINQLTEQIISSKNIDQVKHIVLQPNTSAAKQQHLITDLSNLPNEVLKNQIKDTLQSISQKVDTQDAKVTIEEINNQIYTYIFNSIKDVNTNNPNKQTLTLIDYNSDSNVQTSLQNRIYDSSDVPTIVSKLPISQIPALTDAQIDKKGTFVEELKAIETLIAGHKDITYYVTILLDDQVNKDLPEAKREELIKLVEQVEDLPNAVVNVIETRPSEQTESNTTSVLTNENKPKSVVETVTSIEEITEVLTKIEKNVQNIIDSLGNQPVHYKFVVPNTQDAKTTVDASELKDDKNTVIPDALESIIANVDNKVSPQNFAEAVIVSVLQDLKIEASQHPTEPVPKVSVTDYNPQGITQRITERSDVTTVTQQAVALENVTPKAPIDGKGQLVQALEQVKQVALANPTETLILTVFIDNNNKKPLTEAEIQSIVEEFTQINNLPNVPVINVITTDFNPIQDLVDKIEEESKVPTVNGIKEVDPTIQSVVRTIEELKKQQEDLPEPKENEIIHQVILTPNTPSSKELHDISTVMDNKDVTLPDSFLNLKQVSVNQIVQEIVEQLTNNLIKNEKDLPTNEKSKLTVIDYTANDEITKRVDSQIPSSTTVTELLPLNKIPNLDILSTVPGAEPVGDVSAGVETTIKQINQTSNERFVVTIIIDGTKPLTTNESQELVEAVKLLQESPKLITVNVIVIQTKENDLINQIKVELTPEVIPGEINNCTDAKQCDKVFNELESKPLSDKVDVELIYHILVVQNTKSMDEPVKHTTNRFLGLDTKRDVIEYSVDAFVNTWLSVNHEAGTSDPQPLTVIYLQDDIKNTPLEQNIPENFDLKFPETTKGDTPNIPQLFNKIKEIVENPKNTIYNFVVTMIVEDKSFNPAPEDTKKLQDLVEQDVKPKVETVNIIRLQDESVDNKVDKLKDIITPLETTPGTNVNCSTPDQLYQVVKTLPQLPPLPTRPKQAICAIGYYKNPDFQFRTDKYCLPCNNSCKTCNANGECLQCNEDDNRVKIGTSCPCKANFEEYKSKCVPVCVQGEYRTADNTCGKCDPTCTNCTGPSKDQCSQCPAGQYLQDNLCKNCSDAIQYCHDCKLDGSTVICTNTGCTDINPDTHRKTSNDGTQCICIDGFQQIGDKCIIVCATGYVKNETTCGECHPTCLTCSGPQSTQCITCDLNSSRELVDGSCLCIEGSWQEGPNDATCKKCTRGGSLCSKCNKNTGDCLSCSEEQGAREAPVNGECVCQEEGMGLNTLDQPSKCIPCDPQCKSCQIGGRGKKCNVCATGRDQVPVSQASTGCSSCIVGYSQNASEICVNCHFSCEKCSGPDANQCTECNPINNRIGQVSVTNPGQCKPCDNCTETNVPQAAQCHPTCKKCDCKICTVANEPGCCKDPTLETSCTVCYEHFHLNQELKQTFVQGSTSITHSRCDVDPYYHRETGSNPDLTKAIPCHLTCGEKCVGSSAEECDNCLDKFRIKLNGKCSCIAESTYSIADSASVIEKDPSLTNWVDKKSFCAPCNITCKTCSGPNANECISCDESKDRKLESTSCNCMTTYSETKGYATYLDANGNCSQCPIGCKHCQLIANKVECDLCHENRNINTVLKQCDDPIERYYIPNEGTPTEEKKGKPCHFSCLTCVGPNADQCSSCSEQDNRELVIKNDTNQTGTCSPKQHFYEPNVPKAAPCDYHCTTCTGSQANDCLVCDQTKHFEKLDQNKCKTVDGTLQCQVGPCKAVKGYWDNPNKQTGEPCNKSCTECVNGSETGCLENKCKWANAQWTQAGTLTNTFNGEANVKHGSCPAKETYYIPEENKKEPDCSSIVQKIEIQLPTNDSCYKPLPCSASCVTCNEKADKCTSCDNSKHLILSLSGTTKDTCVCTQGYFKNGDICQQCNNDCLTCDQADKCLSCKGNFNTVNQQTGQCDCIQGTEKATGEINCKPVTKPSVVIPDPINENNEQDEEQCIVIKKVQQEGSSAKFNYFLQLYTSHHQANTMIQANKAFNRTRKSN